MKLDIKELKKMSKVCKLWHYGANYCLSIFREIQYKLPIDKYNDFEINQLWINTEYISGHNKLLLSLLKISETKEDIDRIIKIINKPRRIKCWSLMCSRNCMEKLTSQDIINLICYSFRCKEEKREILLKIGIDNLVCNDNEFSMYIPILVYNLKYESKILNEFLIRRCSKNYTLLNNLYWELNMYRDNDNLIYIKYMSKIKELCSKENNEQKYLELLQGEMLINKFEEISVKVSDNKNYNEIKNNLIITDNIKLPVNTNNIIKRIDVGNIKIKDSVSKPMIIPCITTDNNRIRIMYKRENVRRDQIIMNIIKIMGKIIEREEQIELHIVSYNVLPTDKERGIIEIVEDCETLYHIQERLKTSILNYILENNLDKKIKQIRERFINSTAFYSVLTYLLGVGDRHLDNIMVTRDGRLFHIDYGYILGQGPMFGSGGGIRITPEIVEGLGGTNSVYYNQFQELCTKMYNCIRRNIDIFMNMMLIIPKITDMKISEEEIKQQIIDRFIPGENQIDAKLHLVKQLEKISYTDKIKDWCHYHSREKTINTTIDKLNNALSYIWWKK